jgi:hypothetical protein
MNKINDEYDSKNKESVANSFPYHDDSPYIIV